MNKHDAERAIQRAEHAKRIMNDPLVVEALDGIEKTIFHNFKTSPHKNIEEREDLHKMIQVVERFKKEFEQHIRGGQKAKSFLEKLLNKGD